MVSMTFQVLCALALLSRYIFAIPVQVTTNLSASTLQFSIIEHSTSLGSTPTPLAENTPISSSALSTAQNPTGTISTKNVQTSTTVTVAISSTVTVYVPSSTPFISPSPTTWSEPAQMTDLSSFNVKKFSGNHGNLKIINVVPGATSLSVVVALDGSPQVVTNDSALQVLYPAGSINPANEDRPQGGVQFYAEPLDIKQARNVTLTFSVYFPEDFDFVLAGKLPGLYGGHGGCSGGVSATDCFSTRMMWRKDGEGELYLYAPKDKQTDALCNDPRSTCDVAYGFSIGRGSFAWARGGWTTVSQTVVLNTPGRTDGCFTLDVNGIRVIDRSDVFYRDVVGQPKMSSVGDSHRDGGGGLLGGILDRHNEEKQWLVSVNESPDDLVSISSTVDSPFLVTQQDSAGTTSVAGFIGIFFRYTHRCLL
ncbi:hypothetical protein IW261DRAFT_1496877 [Armillaria novae-zelandiae]|uniref:Polysaccharide lyase 14 domain-containing protein n=1 Tax=Armillaria novae-zelandiae TaxID=153914 RepID=A0AA39NZG8_9AGAR|nr:hypothetical protein IW261DRAFT_1496877 [Armillaria novae-zelandiae]